MINRETSDIGQKQLKGFCKISTIYCFCISFWLSTPSEIWDGIRLIIFSIDALITDYFELAQYGAAFFNGAVMMIFHVIIN